MFLAGPKVKNPLASKLASDSRPFDPGIFQFNLTHFLMFSQVPFW